VYSFLALVEGFYQDHTKTFFSTYKERFENEHKDDIRRLEPLSLPEHVKDSELAKIYLDNKYRLTLSTAAFFQLTTFLEEKQMNGGSVILRIIQTHLKIVTIERASEDRVSIANMLARARDQDDFPAEDEGIPGHNPGSAILDQEAGSTTLARLQLGPLEMEPELLDDVMAELDDEDAKNPPGDGQNSLRAEFDQMIKKEPDTEGPDRSTIPLPASKARDVAMEVQKVKENRDRFKIESKTGGVAAGVSVCMFTFHNTYDR
jgi:transcription initiation factor TFIID subunit 5